MTPEEIKSKIEAAMPGTKLKIIRDSLLLEAPQDLPKVASFLRDAAEFRMDYLSSVTGADYLKFLESVYHFYSMEKKTGPVILRVRVPRDNPKIPSLVPIFRAAELQEREAYDLFGIIYENHPDPRRIFMWEGFEGYPLRKDYLQEESETLEMADVEWLEKHGVAVPGPMRKHAEALAKDGKRAVASKEGKEKA